MDDLVAALLCLPFIFGPLITLLMILVSKIKSSRLFLALLASRSSWAPNHMAAGASPAGVTFTAVRSTKSGEWISLIAAKANGEPSGS